MDHSIFISYANQNSDIIENLRDHLHTFGINAWVYSLDRVLAEDTWSEIEERIRASRMMLFAVSRYSPYAQGQTRELEVALDKIRNAGGQSKIFPVVLDDSPFSVIPEEIRNVNGERLDAYNVKTVAWKLAKRLLPDKLGEEVRHEWRFPVPGDWLQICNLDPMIEEYFDIGDKLYFRAISPLGLLECYAPKLHSLFWISHNNVQRSSSLELDGKLEVDIPTAYTISGMVTICGLGWGEWHKQHGAANS